MTRIFKSNKFVLSLIIILCVFLIFNPKVCSNSCLNAISVWTFNIFPVMFPFFVLTRIIVELSDFKANRLDKFFCKLYNAPSGSLNIFLLSALSGYPMGAKLICAQHEQGKLNNNDAKKLMSFCSVSGPMFMVGTVGFAILKSFKAGIIILIANFIAALINGLIFRGKTNTITPSTPIKRKKENILTDAVYDSIISILMVGGFIVLSFVVLDSLQNMHVLSVFSNTISSITHNKLSVDIVNGFISGFIEMTRGIINISITSVSIKIKTIIASTMVGFGGICVMLQSLSFLKKLNMKFSQMFIQKLCQGLIACLISIILVFIIF